MIAVLPPTKTLGEIEIVETYVYFDGPKLFTSQNGLGQLFLCIWTEESEDSDLYIFVPVTRERFTAVRSGALSLNTAFLQPELGIVFSYSVLRRDRVAKVVPLLPEQVDETLIPGVDQFLRHNTETLPTRFADHDLSARAHAFRREVLGLHLDFAGNTREEAPTGGLGKILLGLQESVDAFGQLAEGEPTLVGVIAPAILSATQTQVVYAGGGSFALEITGNNAVDLFGNSLVTDALQRLTALLAAGNSYEDLRILLTAARPRAASKYKKLLAALVGAHASLRLDWASPSPANNAHIELGFEIARSALRTAEQLTRELGETRIFGGYFDGIEISRRTFFAISEQEGAEFRGKILESAMGAAEHVTIKERYRITIRETIEVTITGDERPRYELEAIDAIVEDTA